MKSAVANTADEPVAAIESETSLASFVSELHREGVAAGRREAEQLVRAAREQAEQLVRQAEAEAEELAVRAREAAAREQEHGRAELEMAARDTLLQLHDAIVHALDAVLHRRVSAALRDPEFLRKVIVEVVSTYARAGAAGELEVVRLPFSFTQQLETWTAELLAAGLRETGVVSATLRDAGFEYTLASGGTVEVSTEAIVEQLSALVRPRLREIIAAAAEPERAGARARAAGTIHPGRSPR